MKAVCIVVLALVSYSGSCTAGPEPPVDSVTRPAAQVPLPGSEFIHGLVTDGAMTDCGERPPAVIELDLVFRRITCSNPSLYRSRASRQLAEASAAIASAEGNPTVQFRGGLEAETGTPAGPMYALSLDYVLFDFGRRDALIEEARQALSAAHASERASVLDAVSAGIQRFTESVIAQGRVTAAAESLAAAQEVSRAVRERAALGMAPLTDRLQAETSLAQAQLEHSRAVGQWFTARGALALALGYDSGASFAVRSMDDADVADPVNPADREVEIRALIEEALERHPRLTAARAQVSAATARATAVKALRWGELSLSSEIGHQLRTDSGASLTDQTAYVGLRWQVPLLDGALLDARRMEGQARISAADANVAELQRDLEAEVWQLGNALFIERASVRSSIDILMSAEKTHRVATERYRSGIGSFTDVVTTQASLTRARVQTVDSKAALKLTQVRLATTVGRIP